MEGTTQKMLSQLHKEVINGIIANYFDCGTRPQVKDVKENWQYHYYNIANDNTISDNVINTIINNVAKYYN